MIVIEAAGKDGQSILPDVQHASPGGSQVTSESRPGFSIGPGDLLRHFGEWVAVAAVAHNGITGITQVAYISHSEAAAGRLSMWRGQSYEVRTDCRIDTDTLYRIAGWPSLDLVTS